MIRSMTGFGAASTEVDGARYVVELRSLNSKYFKALIRLPEELGGLEAELELELGRRLTRGSVVMTVRFSDTSANAAAQINAEALKRYAQERTKDGGYGSVSAYVGSLIRADKRRRALQADVAEGLDSLDRGEGRAFDRDLAERIKARGRAA